MTATLYGSHALKVNLSYALVDRPVVANKFGARAQLLGGLAVGRLVVCVAEARAPVAEVGADDEEVGRVRKVWCELGAELDFGGGLGVADHDGDEGYRGRVGLEGRILSGGCQLVDTRCRVG